MDLLLEFIEGPEAGRQIPLSGSLEIGRDPAVSIVLEDSQVSRHHARINRTSDGAVVHDLGSSNGTYVNDQPIGASQELRPGDRIRVGLTLLQLRSAEQVARRASAVMPAPDITQLDRHVLQPVPEQQLVPVEQAPQGPPGFLAEESEPAFVPRGLVEGGGAPGASGSRGENYVALARLVDARVKHQTSTAAFGVLSLVGLAVLLYFGTR
jgi:hypothetical protein